VRTLSSQVKREEITSTSLPVITIRCRSRLLNDSEYRQRCAIRLVEIVLDINTYMGVSRLFIPQSAIEVVEEV
jgi:hypothetical protein